MTTTTRRCKKALDLVDNRDAITKKVARRLRPVDEIVLVVRDLAEEKTPGGILLPESAKEKLYSVVVYAVGRGRYITQGPYEGSRQTMPCKVGERQIIPDYVGKKVKLSGIEFLLVNQEEMMCEVLSE